MIGIIAAMEVEMEALRRHIKNPSEEIFSGMRFVRGTLGNTEVVTAVCGIGKVFAAMCAQTMILRYAPDALINTGVAGTLTDRLGIGDVAVSACVVQHDMDTSAIGDPVGLISGINKVELPAGDALCEQIIACAQAEGLKTVRGCIASGDQFIADPACKAKIVDTFGAIACEMEGAAIGQVCFVNEVPFCILRAISDCADGSSHMDYPSFVKLAAANSVGLLLRYFAA